FVAYIGTGSPRFYLPLDQQLPATRFTQFVVKARSIEDREEIRSWLMEVFARDFPEARARISRRANGPLVRDPIQFPTSGERVDAVRRAAREGVAQVRRHAAVNDVRLNGGEPGRRGHLNLDQERARALGRLTAGVVEFLATQIT